MPVRPIGLGDVDWAADRLPRRRHSLATFAPAHWKPAADAGSEHRRLLAHLFSGGQAVGFRTDSQLMLAQRGPGGWVLADVAVDEDR